jgi:hypothetical protein
MRLSFFKLCFLIIGFVAGCAPLAVEETSTPEAVIKVDSFPVTQTVNDVTVTFNGFERDVAYLKTNVCFEQPHKENWYSDRDKTFLVVEGQQIPVNKQSFLPIEGVEYLLCGDIEFPVGVSPNLGEVELVIGQLINFVPEPDCEKAQKKLDEANSGIVVNCDIPSIFGDVSGFGISKKPENMSEKEAFAIAEEAFSDTAKGPWRFSFVVQKP